MWTFNQAYNKTTKLTIPQKISENIDSLHIDLLSKTLPVEKKIKSYKKTAINSRLIESKIATHFQKRTPFWWIAQGIGTSLVFTPAERGTEYEGVQLLW